MSIAVIDYRKYPFIADVDEIIKRRWPGLSLTDILLINGSRVSEYAVQIVKNVIEKGKVPSPHLSTEEEVASFYIIVLLGSLLSNKWLIDRIAIAYSKRTIEYLRSEGPETIVAISNKIGVRLQYRVYNVPKIPIGVRKGIIRYKILPYILPLEDYLRISKRLTMDPKYSLVNQIVDRGLVYTDNEIIIRLLGEAVVEYIKKMFKPIKEIPEPLKKYVEYIKSILEEESNKEVIVYSRTRLEYEEMSRMGVVEEAFPPCMKDLINRLRNGENLGHQERFAIAAFLLRIGMDVDDVLGLFKNSPDFNERIARYQIEHIAGLRGSRKQYLPYSCSTMKSLGLCKDPDCKSKNPLNAYYGNLKKMKQRIRKSSRGKKSSSNNRS